MSTQQMSLLQRLIVAIILSGLLFSISSLIASPPAIHAQPVHSHIQQIVGPLSVYQR